MGKLLTTAQAADVIGVNDSRVRQYCRAGLLKHQQVGRAYLIDAKDARAFKRPKRTGRKPKRK